MNQTIDYAPRRRGGITNRLLVVLFAFSGLFVLMSIKLSNATTVDHETAALIWMTFAVCTAALACLIGLVRWIVRGSGR